MIYKHFILEPYHGKSSRHSCPHCHQPFQFVRYIDTQTGHSLADEVGRCNRANHCGYHYAPKAFFKDHPGFSPTKMDITPKISPSQPLEPKKTSYIPERYLKAGMTDYERNHFVIWLRRLFPEKTSSLIARFFIGTSRHWPGASIFWQVDPAGRIHTGKIMLYDPFTGKRSKAHFQWAHRLLLTRGEISDFSLSQCLFGLHQLNLEPFDKEIALVESEKTAVVMSAVDSDRLWLASGGLEQLRVEKLKPLFGRRITLYPDLGQSWNERQEPVITPYQRWKRVAEEFYRCYGGRIHVSDVLERVATEQDRHVGLDLADYLVRDQKLPSYSSSSILKHGGLA